MRRLLLVAAAAVTAVVGLSSMNGCTGPQGPAGTSTHIRDTVFYHDTLMVVIDTLIIRDTLVIDTQVTRDTILMNPSCAACHNNSQTLVEKQQEWAVTKHNEGTTWLGEGTNASCMRCHSGAGYLAFVNGVKITANDSLNTPNANCRTCHKIHTAYDSTDWTLTNVAPVKLIIDTTKTVNLGKGNLCGTCHQSRTSATASVDTGTGANVKLGSRWGGHHSPAVNIVGAIGGWETGDAGVGKVSQITHKAPGNDGCLNCHLSTESGINHRFDPKLPGNVASCNNASCHGAGTMKYSSTVGFIDGTDSVQVNFMKLMNQVRDTLVGRGALILATTDTTTLTMNAALRTAYASALANAATLAVEPDAIVFPIASVAQNVPRAVAGLAFNYWLCLEDKSKGCHNLKYERYLLVSALQAVNPAAVPVYHN